LCSVRGSKNVEKWNMEMGIEDVFSLSSWMMKHAKKIAQDKE